LGWSGVLIEASPSQLKKLKKYRTGSTIVGKAACPAGQESLEFFDNKQVGGAVSEVSDSFAKQWWGKRRPSGVQKVPCAPLGQMLRDAKVDFVDFFSLDVEGSELAVLQTMDWSIPVRVWVVEQDHHNLTKNALVTKILLSHGYRRAHDWSTTKFCRNGEFCAPNEVFEHPDYVLNAEKWTQPSR